MVYSHLFAEPSKEPQYLWKNLLSADLKLPLCGEMKVLKTPELPYSLFWSIGCETIDRDCTDPNEYFPYLMDLGARNARIQGGWAKCEKEPGVYDFAWLDSCVYRLHDMGIKPWICLSYGNPIYKQDKDLDAPIAFNEQTMKAWLNWVETVVFRYKKIVTEWEIWNEPNLEKKNVPVYANLMIKTARCIKRVQPDGKTICMAMSWTSGDFAKGVLDIAKKEGAISLIDYISYHNYTYRPELSYEQMDGVMDAVKPYPSIKLYQGEQGTLSSDEYYGALSNYPWNEISQAKWVSRRMLGDRVRNIRCSIFTAADISKPKFLASYGLIRTTPEKKVLYCKVGYYAFQHIANILQDDLISEGITETETEGKTISVAQFRKNKSPFAFYWYSQDIPSNDIEWKPATVTMTGCFFKDPVCVELLSGRVYNLEKDSWETMQNGTVFHNLPTWDGVMLIAERNQVLLKNSR